MLGVVGATAARGGAPGDFMDDARLLIDLHAPNLRLGPGSEAATRRALELSGLLDRPGLRVADLGCGTGASTLVLAEALDGQITAVDLFPEFLEALERRAKVRRRRAIGAGASGLRGRITTLTASMAALPFKPESLDAIWSEGAIYNLGFEAGVAAWHHLLAPGGVLAVSEITWLSAERPAELQAHWDREYPEIAPASAKLAALERHDFTPIGYFVLPESCWLEHYYDPLQARFPAFLAEQHHSPAACAIVEAETREIELYERHRAHVGYGFYVARRM